MFREKPIFGWIYRITNDVNGKFYIGQSISPVEFRFQRHIGDAIGKRHLDTHFARAIRKYGPEHFHVETIDFAYSQKELTKKESEWIKKTNATELGYNETYADYKCGGNTYISKTPEEMNDICKKISTKNSGVGNGNARAIKMLNVETGEELFFNSVRDAQNRFGIRHHTTLTRICKHERKCLFNDKWKVAYVEDDYDGDFVSIDKKRISFGPRKIEVFDSLTGKTSIYGSYRQFERDNGLKYKSVAVKTTYFKGDIFFFRERYRITLLN